MEKCSFDFCGLEYDTIQVFSERLKQTRISAKLTQQEFAAEMGISVAALSYYEKGKRIPDIVFLSKLCEYFYISPEYFLGITNSRIKENVEISKSLRLSDKAIYNIRAYIDDTYEGTYEYYENSDILNKLLENEKFYSVLDLMTWSGMESCSRVPDNEYINYIAMKKMMDAIAETIESSPSLKSRIIQAIIPDQKEREDYYKWLLEESDNRHEEILNRYKEQKEDIYEGLIKQVENFRESAEMSIHAKAIQNLMEDSDNAKHNPTNE